MDKSTKKLVVQQIDVYLTKYPTATVKDIKKFIFSGSQAADLYPIENHWSILKDEVAKKAPVKDIGHLKRIIAKKWMELNNDKVFLKKMISSVPARVGAMVKLEGAQGTTGPLLQIKLVEF